MKRSKLIEYRGARPQRRMAAIYGVSQRAWNKWENGEGKPRVETMKMIEIDSGIPMEKLFPDVFNNKMMLKDVKRTETA